MVSAKVCAMVSAKVCAMVSARVCAMVSTRVYAMVSGRVCAMVSTRVCAMVSGRGVSNIIRTNIPDTFSHTSISRSEWGIVSSVYEKKKQILFPSLLFCKLSDFCVPLFLCLFF